MKIDFVHINSIQNIYRIFGYRYFDDGRLNNFGIRAKDMTPNTFNDFIGTFYKDKDWIIKVYPGTTDPGLYYLNNPMNVEGTAILKEGQYKDSHALGFHKGYEALVQEGKMNFYRDNNRDNKFDLNKNKIEYSLIACNIHRANPNIASPFVNKWSGACQVIWLNSDYDEFINLCKKVNTFQKRYDYTLLNEINFSNYANVIPKEKKV